MALKQTFIDKGVTFPDIYHKITNRPNIHDYQKVVVEAVEAVEAVEEVLDEEGIAVLVPAVEAVKAVEEVREKWHRGEVIMSRFTDKTKVDQWTPQKLFVDQKEDKFSNKELYIWLMANHPYFEGAENIFEERQEIIKS